MSGQTKLFQKAGSPLIQGHSRYERPFWKEWVLACVPAALSIYGVLAVATLAGAAGADADVLDSTSSIAAWLGRPAVGVAAVLASCALGVAFARRMGWRKAWLVGAVLGAVVGGAVTAATWQAA